MIMANDWTPGDLRRAILETNLWDFGTHLRRLIEEDADAYDSETIENIRQGFESLLVALKAVHARQKSATLSDETAVKLQEHFRFAYWQLEKARSILVSRGVNTSKIPRELAPEKPATASAPPTPRPPSTKPDDSFPPGSPLTADRTLPRTPSESEQLAAFTAEIVSTHLQDSVRSHDSVSRASSSSSMRRRRLEEEAKLKREELEKMNELEREKEKKQFQRQKEEEEKEATKRRVQEE